MLDDHEAPLDDVDLLGVFGLVLHLRQRPAALRTRAVGVGQLVEELDDRQLRLRRRAVTAASARSVARPTSAAVGVPTTD
jgi:hypothetical protein